MANVTLESIKRKFNNVTAIDDITFTIPDGEFWVLVGPSGCGKSTILRTIAGLESATSGKLLIGDKLMNNVPARARDVAMVFQNYALYPHMSVAENIAFGLKMRKVDSNVIRERVETVAHSLSLEHLLERKPKQLSGGQQQRVALGRAIARQPQVFLLDEPLSNLDAQLRDDTRAELKQLHQNIGITTVYVTHDQVEAMTLADKIVVLSGGRIQQIGEPQSIYALPANRMVATFLGNPPMNIIPAKYTSTGFDVDSQVLTIPENIKQKLRLSQGQNIDLGIRPEDIQISDESQAEILQVEVKLVEPLGRETLIRVAVLGTGIILNVQISGNIRFRPGDKLNLQLDVQKIFIFDSASGDRLYP
ncbi:ABC transporter-like protein [Calothrix parasitica NIES-267]|uniref:ABC transporter-like protein n=1 Tax=Calothrix parasitica NIES-267 TaxID=1973488 RepID=A0A1Z4LYF2_9CYAN|nr:ABC transporter-like protein [Calothrix parasitica NIES-267]